MVKRVFFQGKGSNWQHIVIWWMAARPHTLGATLSPFVVAGVLAHRQQSFEWGLWLCMLLAVLLLQIGANLTDEFSDHLQPLAKEKYPAPHKVIARGLLSVQAVRSGAFAVFGLAGLLGVFILWRAGWALLPLCLAGLAVAWFYSAGKFPLGGMALGELLVFVALGPALVTGIVRAMSGFWSLEALWHAVPVGALVSAVLLFNNLRDENQDRQAGKRTLVTQLGAQHARKLLTGLFLLALAWPLLTMRIHLAGRWMLLSWICLPLLVKAWRTSRGVHHGAPTPDELHQGLRITAAVHLLYGLLLATALWLDA